MPASPNGILPRTVTDWLNAAERHRVRNTSLLGFNDHHSGSQVTFRQFLTFRTLVIPHPAKEFDPAQWGLAQNFAIAAQELDGSQDFLSFINAMRHPPAQPTGDFSQIPKMYAEVTREPNNLNAEKLQKADETPVNVSLICLLQAIADVPTKAVAEWRHTKVRFEAQFGTLASGERRKMTAITDGQLQSRTSHEVRAIVECKRRARTPQNISITMQESALLLAWIKEFPRSPNSYVLIHPAMLYSEQKLTSAVASLYPKTRCRCSSHVPKLHSSGVSTYCSTEFPATKDHLCVNTSTGLGTCGRKIISGKLQESFVRYLSYEQENVVDQVDGGVMWLVVTERLKPGSVLSCHVT